ncbi:MAG TPA: MAPEG family protein [Rhizomicrobium sp.]|nr:MAPEG family protein [Rhizomicrobium sp.]
MGNVFASGYGSFYFYVAVNAAIMLALAVLVVRARQGTQTAIGDGGNPAMIAAVRAHGNNTEYVPMGLLLLWSVVALGGSIWLVHGVGASLTLGRLLHGFGLSRSTGVSTARLLGVVLTWAAFVVGIVAVLWLVFVLPGAAS